MLLKMLLSTLLILIAFDADSLPFQFYVNIRTHYRLLWNLCLYLHFLLPLLILLTFCNLAFFLQIS